MNLLVIIINETEKLDNLLVKFNDNGILGGTILDSQGMAATLCDWHHDIKIFGGLRSVLSNKRPYNKTLLMVLDDEKLEKAKGIVREVISDIDKINTGIMFTVKVSDVEGLTK